MKTLSPILDGTSVRHGAHTGVHTQRIRRYRQIVSRFEESVRGKEGEPFDAAAFCRAVGAGQRTVSRAFQAVCGMAFKRYLRLLRLREVRRALLSTTNQGDTVTQIAVKFGFQELGQFARHYRMTFGESPSETLRGGRGVQVDSDQAMIATSPSNQESDMPTRRTFVAAASALVASSAAPLQSAFAQAAQEPPKQADFLFVQSAKGMTFDKASSKLTLTGVSPVTVFFTDRPDRIAGNMKTTAFIPFWSEGKDSFQSDPPNADISLLEGGELKQIVVVLQDPVLRGDNLAYTVKVLQGDMPAEAKDVSVFIDIIGRPLTPFSYAGVARRTYRRAFYFR